ncbi:P-loop NTPase fold protein [Rhizobium sp. 768_B6_N1_8]|uniref:P-loop NTPase fold protein n=1 Tax=unclassified Rhizobium TaxID=2613769 RepID=UPI003F28C23F
MSVADGQFESRAVEATVGPYNPWAALEEASIRAFQISANRLAPGLVGALQRAVHYAQADPSTKSIVIDRIQFLLGVLSIGGLDEPSAQFGNTATWMAEFVRQRATGDVSQIVKSRLVSADSVIEAHRSGAQVVASQRMEAIGKRAIEIAETTVHRSPADLRHHVAAFLEDKQACQADFAELGWRATVGDLVRLKRRLLKRIAIKPEANEDLTAWQHILWEDLPLGTFRDEVPGFASDQASAPFVISGADVLSSSKSDPSRDPLDLKTDVKAFARLICLEEAEPPMSIGVFGGWGSGKSTFMQLLEQAVAQLAKGQKKRREEEQVSAEGLVGEPRFITNVVQIRFNAWHFADANLWASLTAEFFDQLRAGGYEGSGKAIHRRLVERVNDHVHALTSEAATARQALAESEKALQKRQKERDSAVAEAKSEKSRKIGQTLADAVTTSFNEHKADLIEMGHRTYADHPKEDIEDFVKLAKSVQSLPGQIKTLRSYIFARGARAAVAIVSFALLVFFTAWIWPKDIESGAVQLNALGVFGFIASLGGLARTILPGVKLIGGLAKSTAGFAKELDDLTTEEIKAVAKADEAVLRAATEAQARKAAADRAAKALSRYIDPKAGTSNPPRLLRYMLEDDPDTRALEKEIGLISRIRRLFQAVDEIVSEEKRKPTRATGEEEGRDPDVPDRIVIYIDDLDRCTPSQVYAVLQAVHLLLAFRLFVVVVGVDVAWVEHSLSKEFGPSGASPEWSDGLAIRYLEKIFQLPFWLQRLSTDGSDGGSYARFVRLMLEGNLASQVASPLTIDRPAFEPNAERSYEQNSIGQTAGDTNSPNQDAISVEFETSGLDDALSTVQMTIGEIDFLANDAIGRLAGDEPRTVKRFINIYRIIRARLDEEARRSFLGEGDAPAEYPIVCALIAIETGQSSEIASAFYAQLNQTPILDMGQVRPDPIGAAFQAATAQRGGVPVSSQDCKRLSASVRRYSFNPIR